MSDAELLVSVLFRRPPSEVPQALSGQERRLQLIPDVGAAEPDFAQQAVVEVLKGAPLTGELAPPARGLERRAGVAPQTAAEL